MPRPKMAIRDLLWLTLVAALALGWWVDRRAQSARASEWIREVNRLELEAFQQRIQRTQSGWTNAN